MRDGRRVAADGDDGRGLGQTVLFWDARSMKINDREIVFAVSQVRFSQKGKVKESCSASGFFYEHKDKLYFITNRHVVIDKEKCHYPDELKLELHKDSINLLGNRVYTLPLYTNLENLLVPRWLAHPRGEDRIDVVAVPVEGDLSDFHVQPFTAHDLPDIITISRLSIWDKLTVIGYPNGRYDKSHNLPIIRNAAFASVPTVPFKNEPRILIDAQLHGGTSGSPVVLGPGVFNDESGKLYHRSGYVLIGVHSGEFDQNEPELGLHNVWLAGLIPDIISQNSHYFESLGCEFDD